MSGEEENRRFMTDKARVPDKASRVEARASGGENPGAAGISPENDIPGCLGFLAASSSETRRTPTLRNCCPDVGREDKRSGMSKQNSGSNGAGCPATFDASEALKM
jgi:hypothetical protein